MSALVDNTPPVVRVVVPPPGAVLAGAVRLEADARDTGAGVDSVRFEHSFDGLTWRPIQGDVWEIVKPNDLADIITEMEKEGGGLRSLTVREVPQWAAVG